MWKVLRRAGVLTSCCLIARRAHISPTSDFKGASVLTQIGWELPACMHDDVLSRIVQYAYTPESMLRVKLARRIKAAAAAIHVDAWPAREWVTNEEFPFNDDRQRRRYIYPAREAALIEARLKWLEVPFADPRAVAIIQRRRRLAEEKILELNANDNDKWSHYSASKSTKSGEYVIDDVNSTLTLTAVPVRLFPCRRCRERKDRGVVRKLPPNLM